jgi:hypothetical protein
MGRKRRGEKREKDITETRSLLGGGDRRKEPMDASRGMETRKAKFKKRENGNEKEETKT